MAKEFKYKIHKEIISLSISSRYENSLQVVSWNGFNKPKYDIRRWRIDKEGNFNPTKGISLSPDEMQKLKDKLNEIEDFNEYLKGF